MAAIAPLPRVVVLFTGSSMALVPDVASGSPETPPIPYYVIAAVVSLAAAVVVATWTTAQALQRGWRFRRLIRRELAEIGPHPKEPDPRSPDRPWWEFATKRTVHEEIFRREHISENRDFILSLDPTIVYRVTQLWIALEKRDGPNWVYFMGEVAATSGLRSPDLTLAHRRWADIMASQPEQFRETMGIPTPFRQSAALNRAAELFKARFSAYGTLLPILDQRRVLAMEKSRHAAGEAMTEWYYEGGNGLLLSGRALTQFLRTREVLGRETSRRSDVEAALTALRTDLKIDLGVRQPQERGANFGWPEDERW